LVAIHMPRNSRLSTGAGTVGAGRAGGVRPAARKATGPSANNIAAKRRRGNRGAVDGVAAEGRGRLILYGALSKVQ